MPEPRFPKLYSPYRPRLSTQPTMSSIDETIDPSSSSKSSSSNYDVYNSYGSRMPDNLQRHVNGTHPSSLPLALQAGRRSGQNAGTIRRLHETNVNPLPFEFTPGDDAAFTAIKLPRAENQNGASGVNGTGTRPSSLPLPSQTNPDLLNDMIGGGGRSGAVQGGGAIQRKSERSLKEVEKRARNSLWKENYDNACGEISEHYWGWVLVMGTLNRQSRFWMVHRHLGGTDDCMVLETNVSFVGTVRMAWSFSRSASGSECPSYQKNLVEGTITNEKSLNNLKSI